MQNRLASPVSMPFDLMQSFQVSNRHLGIPKYFPHQTWSDILPFVDWYRHSPSINVLKLPMTPFGFA